jgi:hypothetical protein
MPVIAAYRRSAGRARHSAANPEYTEPPAPLLYGRDRAWLSGGVLGYRVGVAMQGTSPRLSVGLHGGGELLGGDAEISAFSSYTDAKNEGAEIEPVKLDINGFRWRYVATATPLVRQVEVGRLSSDGLRALSFNGVSITNQPVQVERFFGYTPLHVVTGPQWEVELYLNYQLIETRRADAAGICDFQVPITYGSTQVRTVEYGPNGEVRESERHIQIPFTFVPRGQFRYEISAGKEALEGGRMVQASSSIGLTRWLTLKAGADYLQSETASVPTIRSAYGILSSRVGGPFIVTAKVSPGQLYSFALNAYHPSLLTYNIEFTRYGTQGLYNQTHSENEAQASLNAPFKIRGIPVFLRLNATERKTAAAGYGLSIAPEISIQPGGLQMNVGLRTGAVIDDGRYDPTMRLLETRVGYSFPHRTGFGSLMNGMLVSTRSTYDLQLNRLQSFNTTLSRTISRYARAQLDLSHLPQSGVTSLGFGLQLTLPYARVSGGIQSGSSLPITTTQDFSGAVSYDGGTRSFRLLQQDWVGQAAATLRMFVDTNGNGHFDEGETMIPNGAVQFRRAVSTQPGPAGTITASNLQAYEQYSLEIDQTKIQNPFWVPKYPAFSFVTDPNRNKMVDVPFYVSGEVRGNVSVVRNGSVTAVPGIKVHIRAVDGSQSWEQPAFSDGSFDVLGLPAGEYEASVDSAQLRTLSAVSEPAVRRFTVAATETGDSVSGIDFLLRAADVVEDPAAPAGP